MKEKLDYKKQYKDLYVPPPKPALICVPKMSFIGVDGRGAPLGEEYQAALKALYSLSFTIKMSKMAGENIPGYFEYVVPPLEGLWHSEGRAPDFGEGKEHWRWTSMIRQPEFVTPGIFEWALEKCAKKNPEADFSKARLFDFEEGLCVQILHVGSYDDEGRSISQITAFIAENGLEDLVSETNRHHEIYLSDPRKTAPEKLKTVIRHPARRL